MTPWFSKTEGNIYATFLHHPFLFREIQRSAQEVARRISGAIEPRSPPDTPAYYARDTSNFWLDLSLLKVVICEGPTPSEDYMDYKLIALFNMGLVYLESGRHTSLWLIINPVEATFLSDAIVHNGIVYTVDAQIGCLYWWNLSSCNCSISSHLYLMNTTACSFVTNLECIACL